MERAVLRNSEGMTLIEVLIAFVIFLIVSLALLHASTLLTEQNVKNALRDEAVNIAEARMIDARNTAFSSLTPGSTSVTITRNFRNIASFTYQVTRLVTDLGTDNKQIDITVGWTWRGGPSTHTIRSIVRR